MVCVIPKPDAFSCSVKWGDAAFYIYKRKFYINKLNDYYYWLLIKIPKYKNKKDHGATYNTTQD